MIGKVYEGFPDERWLDVSHFERFAKPLEERIAMWARKRFDAVEPDNVAGRENDTGFQISGDDQLRFNRWIANQVHARGMAVFAKPWEPCEPVEGPAPGAGPAGGQATMR